MKSNALKTGAAMAVLCVFGICGYVMKLSATPASGVIRTLIGRGTYDRFMVNTDTNQAPIQYIAKAQPAIDMEVDTHYYNPLGSTGWHKHPGPVYITVTSGQLTFYEFDDPTCSPHVYKAGRALLIMGTATSASTRTLTTRPAMLQWQLPTLEDRSAPSFRLAILIAAFDVVGARSIRRGTVWVHMSLQRTVPRRDAAVRVRVMPSRTSMS